MTKEQHEKRNMLTEHEQNYKRYNREIIDAYNALNPPTVSKLSMAIFNVIMFTKRHSQPTSRDYNKNEARRIFNNQYVTLEDLLNRCSPIKYGVDKKPVANDVSNLMGRLQELDDKNIFYIWRYGKPYTYMFVMERDIGVWQYFNLYGCVTPKTVNKVVALSNSMIDTMICFEKTRGRPVKLSDVESSFVGDFIPQMIGKMNKKTADKLPLWNKTQAIADYLTELRTALGKLDEYDGLEEDPLFLERLPIHLKTRIDNNGKKMESKKMDTNQLSQDLVPKDENLTKEPRQKKKRIISSKESIKPDRTSFKSIDPFANCNHFMKYYREVISLYNKNARFYPADSERTPATQIMDLLIQSGKSGDMEFLRSWIRYYIGSYLQGNNVYKQEKTSLVNFKKTFSSYEGKYFKA